MPEGNAQAPAPQAEQAAPAAEKSLLDRTVEETRLGQTDEEKLKAKSWLQAYIDDVEKGHMRPARTTDAGIAERIADLDKQISEKLNQYMHHPKFQKLEASWRGLHYLVDQTETSTMLKIKVLNLSKRELLNDLENAVEFDQSALFKKIYEEEYGTLGGDPFGLLVGDFEFGRNPEDLTILSKISGVAAAAHAPFVSAAAPSMFGWDSFTELEAPRDLAKGFDNDLYVRWKSFRESEDSRYVGLTLPHMLLRDPYGKDSKTIEAFDYDEKVDGQHHDRYLWGNAAYAMATRITKAFSNYEWCAAIRGVEGGGLVEGLPTHTFEADGEMTIKCPTEISITDRREKELADLGFIPLCHHKHSDKAVFFSTQSCQKPKDYYNPDAKANARLSTQLQYILAISRFAHFLKVMMRDKVGAFTSQSKLQTDLNDWVKNYVLLDDNADQDAKATYPLRDARIEIKEVAGKPGSYEAVAYLRPHFQLDELTVSLRLVAKVPAQKQ